MSMDALISSLEEEVSSVEDVLAATTKAYSRRAYGEKAWKAADDFLVKQYGPVDAVKILHHKAMRRAHDAAEKRDVRGIVASVKSTVSTWPVKDTFKTKKIKLSLYILYIYNLLITTPHNNIIII